MRRTEGSDTPPLPSAEHLCSVLMSRHTRLAYGLGPLIHYLDIHDIDPEPVLDAAGIPRLALDEPACHITLEQEIEFTRRAIRLLQRPDSGLLVGQAYHLNMFGVLGLAASSCTDVLSMIRLFFSYPMLAWGTFETSLWRNERHCLLRFEERVELGDCRQFYAERDLTCLITVLRDVLGSRSAPLTVSFSHTAPSRTASYGRFFGCEVKFAAPATELLFDARVLTVPLPQANEASRRLFEGQCRAISRMLEAPANHAELVRRWLRWSSPIGSMVEIASALRLNERTLQRRLAAEGTTFSTLLREVRLERARKYLELHHMTLQDIAERLGYQDAVAFCHAFKSWTGESPRQSAG